MRHRYECPMRWADLDPLGHINNVVYVDYLQEARVDMLRTHGPAASTGELAEGTVVVRHEVTYVSPLHFGDRPVSIESWVTQIRAASFTLAYEIFHEDAAGDRQVYLRATTVLTPYVFATERPRRLRDEERESLRTFLEPEAPAPRPPIPVVRPDHALRYPVQVRFSDVDVYGHVNNVKYFEYFQEARISGMARMWEGLAPVTLVVAQTDVDYRVPILFRAEEYDAWTWATRVGQRSATLESVICDGDTILSRARVTIVFFDRHTQRSVAPDEVYLERLRALLPAPEAAPA
ncbi:acyl-CoA thioesterase [Nocardioides sp. LMS-CY]|uniref:Acyl-CoA thioester hydrolase n=1 Tax=Nocardioides soli TaxID=1036020 RepID=A0A7W4VSI2_9ACTN|nr:thioesterase family protein [Nocardioides sp. LMS-CY]MBB3040943.1 acyl-CoA thioester hydrolase [Nocardioides soli]QWF23648.1 acyl-CoA thioesterase [Nocardioides sp. LMS-CY]